MTATYQEVEERQRRLTSFEARPLSLERLEGGSVLWANVPTFAVNKQEEIAAMHALIEALRQELAANRQWRLLVFDLRGNSGGDSRWGDQMASAVFGEGWAKEARVWLSDGVYTEWRVSPDHVASLRGIVQQQEQRFGADSEGAKYFRAFADSMQTALQEGKTLLAERGAGTPQGAPRPKAVTVPGRIVLLTSASCFSACLGFLDRMRLHPSVVQVGQPTGVDTVYMENWGKNLPSGMARIGWPMKVYRNRRRANNESYAPHVAYSGRLSDTNAVRDWIIKRYL